VNATTAGQPAIRVEGPPPGFARGRFDVPRWSIGAFGALLIVAGIAYMLMRLRRSKRGPS
jgi:hypothetical protein